MEETVQKLRQPVDEVQGEVKKRQHELQEVLVLSQEFETISEEFITWLAAIEEEQANEKTVSAVYETVKKQQQENKVGRIRGERRYHWEVREHNIVGLINVRPTV